MTNLFHYSKASDKGVDEVVEALRGALAERKFGVLWQLDMTQTLQGKGFDFKQPYRILEVCNPFEANGVLTQNPLVGYFLPCKIVVYEDEGKTQIGLPLPTLLIDMVGDDKLRETAERIEATLKSAVDDAAKDE